MWGVDSFLASGSKPARHAAERGGAAGPAVVALSTSEHDRKALSIIAKHQLLDVHFAKSPAEARDLLNQFQAPVMLCDSDWPGTHWHVMVRDFASSPLRPCVILASRIPDEQVWEELVRCGGHDLVAKPLRLEDLSCALKLAISYWTNARPADRR